ncbi:MAG: PAS domain-containing protein [Desulfofustis sp.]|nr:PAS domain-containing protein [Desulfofustis sp.]MBT8345181.1 PAS domain-containing protein [Desulfofustis sp.]MBT8355531.1 PAS domain-containing protein [Desulfofustis sp.]NNK58832.1 PAS domain-containing protein [Desulfofustis sp.]
MIELHRNYALISVVLLVYTIIMIIPYTLDHLTQPQSLVWSLFGWTVLFSLVLFIIIRLHDEKNRKSIEAMKQKLAETERNKQDVEDGHHQVMEKKLLEIGMINASLNREVAERMQAETESRELQKQMELILNSAGEGIFGLDIHGNVTFVNTAASLMTGWEREEMIGKPHHELVHHTSPDGSPHVSEECLINQACRDGLVHISAEDCFWTREGDHFPVEYVSTPIVDEGRLCGAVVVFRDKSTFS